jgi:cytochrome c oxidase subunit II
VQPNGTDRARVPSSRRRLRRALTSGAVTLTLALSVTGCSSEELPRLGFPTPATENADRILSLWQGSWAAAFAVGAVVWGLIVWSAIFHRKRGEGLPRQTRYNVPIEALYTIVPFIMVLVLFYFTARDESKIIALSDEPDHEVNVVGRQWSWTFNYLEADAGVAGSPGKPPTLVLPQGETVRFTLTSPDVIHSFWVPAFLFKMDVIPGRTNEFEITPDQQGTYMGKCAELCGVDHSRMLFNVKVVSPEEYDRYVSELEAEGRTVTADDAPTVTPETAQ